MGLDNNSGIRSALERAQTFNGTRNSDWTPFITTFSDLKIPDMSFCLVPVGSFQMGSDDISETESPVHTQVIQAPYFIAQYPVTNAQWAIAVKARVVKAPDSAGARRWYRDPTMANAPVVDRTWDEARKFAEWIGCRLPSELEWEYAARGVESLAFPWGNEWDPDACVYNKNSGGKPATVENKPKDTSWVGARHLSGNVAEWMNSAFESYPYESDHEHDGGASVQVLRGGHWNSSFEDSFHAAVRTGEEPHIGYDDTGFRLALSLESLFRRSSSGGESILIKLMRRLKPVTETHPTKSWNSQP